MRAKWCAVNAKRNSCCIIAGLIFKAEAFGYSKVNLIGGDCKFTAGDAINLYVDLWSVKGCLLYTSDAADE